MEATRFAKRLLFFLPLLGAAAAINPYSGASAWLGPGAAFFAVATYARLGALALGRRGRDEALLALECLPFLAYGAACLGAAEPAGLALFLLSSLALWAFLLSLEDLLAPKAIGFSLVLADAAAFALAAAALDRLPPAATVGGGAACLALSRYAAARRRP
ncbi:MAG TPA: hypothetical protein P5165_01330 [Spirochaetia bacterium]|nr:hypothetical protein [Spirochaetales bacterium]HRY71839.1 hypothetical protein [Spirochaetia bacterium]